MGFVGRALVLLFIASSAACGPAPRKPALSKAAPVPAPQKVAAPAPPSAPSELERLLLEAKELEARGVVDMAARRFVRAYNLSRDDQLLVEAARLYELAWNHEQAGELLERLTRSSQHESAARQRLAQLPVASQFSAQQLEQTEALLSQAQQQLEAADLARARDSLQAAGKVAWTPDVLRALATLDWKTGNGYAAQLGWSRVRSTRGVEIAAALLSAVPTLGWGNDDFTIASVGGGGWGPRSDGPQLRFAAADGEIFGYSLELGSFARFGESLFEPWQLVTDRRGRTRGTTLLAPRELALEGAELPSSMGEVVARAATDDGVRAAFINSKGELWRLEEKTLTGLEQVFYGALSERGRPLALSIYDSLLLYAGSGKAERLYLAPVRTLALSRSEVGEVLELSLEGEVLRKWQAHQKKLLALATTRDGRYLATSAGAEVKVWDLRSLKAVSTQRMESDVPFLSFHPSDDVLELGQAFRVQSLDWRNGKLLGSRETDETAALVHSRDGRYSASRLAGSGAITLSRDRGGEQREIVGALSSLAELSDDKQRLLVSGPALWLFQLQPWRATQLRQGPAWRTALSPNGELIAFWAEQRVEVVDSFGKSVASLDVAKEPETLTFASDERLVVGDGKMLSYFELPGGRKVDAHAGRQRLRLGNGSLLVEQGRVTHSINHPPATQTLVGDRVFLNQARSAFAVTDRQGGITVYDVKGRQLAQASNRNVPGMMTISDDGAFVVASFTYPSPAIWQWDLQADTWRQIQHGVHAGLSGVSSLTFMDSMVISGGADGIVAWDVKSGARGSLNLLEGGGWFSIAQTEDFSAVDGVPEAIDHVVNETLPSHPGSVWEGLRHTGSFGQLLRGLPLPSLADFPSE